MSDIPDGPGGGFVDGPGTQPGSGTGTTRETGTLVDYLLAWSAPDELYYVDMKTPIKFAFSRADGETILLDDADTLTLSVTKPDGSSVNAGTVKVSSTNAASIEVAAMYQFGVKDTHVFELTIVHDDQEIIARKTMIVY